MVTETLRCISATELSQQHQAGGSVDLIDVRTPVEFQEIHVEFARNEPLDRLDPARIMEQHGSSDEPLYVMCRTGNRAKQAIEKFRAAGFENVVNVDGGILQWEVDHLSVVRGKKSISLERQVRIAAGSLVLIGVILGYFVHPLGFFLSAFVGGGLIFSGVTDTCGMGMLLAKMPWNKVNLSPECKIQS
jgi:rhodanese-related sulfurtransferase